MKKLFLLLFMGLCSFVFAIDIKTGDHLHYMSINGTMFDFMNEGSAVITEVCPTDNACKINIMTGKRVNYTLYVKKDFYITASIPNEDYTTTKVSGTVGLITYNYFACD